MARKPGIENGMNSTRGTKVQIQWEYIGINLANVNQPLFMALLLRVLRIWGIGSTPRPVHALMLHGTPWKHHWDPSPPTMKVRVAWCMIQPSCNGRSRVPREIVDLYWWLLLVTIPLEGHYLLSKYWWHYWYCGNLIINESATKPLALDGFLIHTGKSS